jgi:uncharacterized membrane protein
MTPELQVFFLAMSPISELRLSIPLGIKVWHLAPWSAFIWSVLGNIIPAAILLLILDSLTSFLGRYFSFFRKGLEWWFKHVRQKFQNHYLKWGMFALVIFVAIPLPGTGAWTGATAAYLFGIPPLKAFFLILLGLMIAGIIVTAISIGFLTFRI